MTQLVGESRVVDTPKGVVLEIIFRGVHNRSHGTQMSAFITGQLAETSPVAILINLLEYKYVFGNDIGAAVIATFRHRPIIPGCIVATGTTHSSLHNLMSISRLLESFPLEFASSLEEGLQCLSARLD